MHSPTNNPLNFNSRVPRVEVVQRKQRNYNHLKPVYETMKWKDYALSGPRKNSIDNVQRLSAKNSIRGHNSPSYHHEQDMFEKNVVTSRLSQRNLRQENLRLSGTKYNPRDQEINRVKQDAVRRVKMLQQKVLPLISHEQQKFRNDQQQYGLAWQLKMQQRLIKIQNNIENVRNQMEIKFQKKLIQMERVWESRFNQLLEICQINNLGIGNDKLNQEEMTNGFREEQSSTENQQQPYKNGNYKYYRSGFNNNNNNNNEDQSQEY